MTDKELELIKQAAQKTWQYIGGDCQSLDGWQGKHNEIWEMVGDRISFIGGLSGDALEAYHNNYKEVEKLSKGWF